MARSRHKLADRSIRAAKGPAVLMDGAGLRLAIDKAGAKRWRFRYSFGGREREMGLGVWPDVSLADAREAADAARADLKADRDPLAPIPEVVAAPVKVAPTFGDAADAYLDSMESGWRNPKHRAQWRMTLTTYAAPIRNIPVDQIDTEAVLSVLKPHWQARPETASRLRGRIESVLDASTALGHRRDANPARWRGHLAKLLPKRQKLSRGHHAAMPYAEVAAFLAELLTREAMAALALEFVILTAARSGEVLGATWGEIDIAAALWTVPATRMKAGREHRVPLTVPALAILDKARPLAMREDGSINPAALVFPGKSGGQLSVMAMTMLMRRMKREAFTVHGFRSAFRDWAGEVSSFPTNIAEAALAHVIGDKTEAAYARGDLLAKRRKLMEAWAAYVGRVPGADNVRAFGRDAA